jgi:hypothetical protein
VASDPQALVAAFRLGLRCDYTARERAPATRGQGDVNVDQRVTQQLGGVLPGRRSSLGEEVGERLESAPLMPMRRWMRHPSIGIPASASASCHEKTCA